MMIGQLLVPVNLSLYCAAAGGLMSGRKLPADTAMYSTSELSVVRALLTCRAFKIRM